MYLTILQPPAKVMEDLWPKDFARGQTGDLRYILLPVIVPLLTLATLSVLLRIFARWKRRCLGVDDILIVISLIPAVAVNVLLIQQKDFGFGMHVWNAFSKNILTSTNIDISRLRIYIIIILSSTSNILIRFSILLSFYRIFSNLNELSTRRILRYYMIFFFITTPFVIFAEAFQCTPARAAWDPSAAGSNCQAQRGILVSDHLLNCISNLLIFCLPLVRLWRLNLSRAQRVGLIMVFVLGFAVCILSTARLAMLIRALFYDPLFDYTWTLHPVFLLCSVENSLAIACSCAPVLRHYVDLISCTCHKHYSTSSLPPAYQPSSIVLPDLYPHNLPRSAGAETSGWYDAESIKSVKHHFWRSSMARIKPSMSSLRRSSVPETGISLRDQNQFNRNTINLNYPLNASSYYGGLSSLERAATSSPPPPPNTPETIYTQVTGGRDRDIRRGSLTLTDPGASTDTFGRRNSNGGNRSSWHIGHRVEISQPNDPDYISHMPTVPRHVHNPSRERRAIGEVLEMMEMGPLGVIEDYDRQPTGSRGVNRR